MNKTRSAFILVVLVAIVISQGCGSPLPAPTTTPPSPSPRPATAAAPSPSPVAAAATPLPTTCQATAALIPESTEDEVRALVNQGYAAGIVVGIVSPCGSAFYSYGSTALSGGHPIDEDTVFEIGSVGKVFTALLLVDMVERGEVALDDPIQLYIPAEITAPKYRGRSITLVDLATHTSGLASLPDNFNPADELNPYADYTVEQMYDALERTTLPRRGGTKYEYSNLGMGLLGHILTLRSGMSYEELVVTRIADELGMPSTRITLTADMQSRLATGYREGEPFPLWDIPTLAGAGALRSTARDLVAFVAANLGLQESRLYEAMQVTHEPRYPAGSTAQVGLAWHILTLDGRPVVEHHGATGGYWSYVGFIEEYRTGVVVLTNTFQDVDAIGHNLLKAGPTLCLCAPAGAGAPPQPGTTP